MPISSTALPTDYWDKFEPTKIDIEFITNYLFDKECPLTENEITPILINERIRKESDALLQQRKGGSETYIPEGNYSVGTTLAFPALDWQKGTIVSIRPGNNSAYGDFSVIEVEFSNDIKRKFASRFIDHKLNHPSENQQTHDSLNPDRVIENYGSRIEAVLAKSLHDDRNLVQVAGRWFSRALLMDISVGHLNLAEAVLDEAGGQPLATKVLIEQIALPSNENPNLIEFSMNYALQEDDRFDEVGPAGEVLWCLKRLEPMDVQQIPAPLRYTEIDYDRSVLTKEMLALESSIDDELSSSTTPVSDVTELTISLIYPHWRAGTLPVLSRTRMLFPTAYESERVRFTLIDSNTKEEIPAWVVRRHGYVAGLKAFYQKYNLIPGSLITLRKGAQPGKVIIEPRTRRPMRDWVRTVLVGSDGGIVFANLKQNVTTEFNERMVLVVPDVAGVDAACEQVVKSHTSLDKLVANMMQELTKLNVQGHVHAQELYSALNIVHRCPVGVLLAHLSRSSLYKHVGDLHFRLVEAELTNE
jgi:hypothetical protein